MPVIEDNSPEAKLFGRQWRTGVAIKKLYNLRWDNADDWHFGVYFVHPENPPESHFRRSIEEGKIEARDRPTRAVAEHGPLPAIWESLEKHGYIAIQDLANETIEVSVDEDDSDDALED